MTKSYTFKNNKQNNWLDEPGQYDVVITGLKIDYTSKGEDMMTVIFSTCDCKVHSQRFFFSEAASKRIDWLLTAAGVAGDTDEGGSFEVSEDVFRKLLLQRRLKITVGWEKHNEDQKALGYAPRLEVKRYDASGGDSEY